MPEFRRFLLTFKGDGFLLFPRTRFGKQGSGNDASPNTRCPWSQFCIFQCEFTPVTPRVGVHLLSVEDGLCAHYLIRLLDGSPNQNERIFERTFKLYVYIKYSWDVSLKTIEQ
jgi:hypothetical protein